MEAKDIFLSSQLITYLGNKRKLVSEIEKEVIIIKGILGKDTLRCFDGFSGSGVVARMLKYHSSSLHVNDMEGYAHMLNQCYLANPSQPDIQTINSYIEELNQLTFDYEGMICQNYAPKVTNDIQPCERAFYTRENALTLDTIRHRIEEYPEEYRKYLLGPLLVKASIHTNTSGVFKGFHKKEGVGHFGGAQEVDTASRITKPIVLDPPRFSDQRHACEVVCHNREILSLVGELPDFDVAYLDPPYNQHPYGSNYFMLTTILENEPQGELSTVSGIPKNWKKSDYNYKRTALQSLTQLLKTIKATFIILSYNNEGIIQTDELRQLWVDLGLEATLREIDYQTYRGSRNLKNRSNTVQEYLWILTRPAGHS